uniref:Uncharacterized protein n=1 Tax=Glossina austeni TaxID=7395 RepID=A0A1A9UGL0_GLOAU
MHDYVLKVLARLVLRAYIPAPPCPCPIAALSGTRVPIGVPLTFSNVSVNNCNFFGSPRNRPAVMKSVDSNSYAVNDIKFLRKIAIGAKEAHSIQIFGTGIGLRSKNYNNNKINLEALTFSELFEWTSLTRADVEKRKISNEKVLSYPMTLKTRLPMATMKEKLITNNSTSLPLESGATTSL